MDAIAAVGYPTNLDGFMNEGEPLVWEGIPYHAGVATDIDPVHLGRDLIDMYWQLDANIELWWDRLFDGSDVVEHIPCEWAYIGTPRSLIILHWDASAHAWWVGICAWSEDPVETVYTIHEEWEPEQ